MSAIYLHKPNANHCAHPDSYSAKDRLWKEFLALNLYGAYEVRYKRKGEVRQHLICLKPSQLNNRFQIYENYEILQCNIDREMVPARFHALNGPMALIHRL